MPKIETATGVINGSNTNFSTSASYTSGTLVVFVNGQAKLRTNDDGWIETGATTFQMKVAPLTGDILQVYY